MKESNEGKNELEKENQKVLYEIKILKSDQENKIETLENTAAEAIGEKDFIQEQLNASEEEKQLLVTKVEEAKEFILKLKSEKEALGQQIQSLQEQSSKQVSEIDVAI